MASENNFLRSIRKIDYGKTHNTKVMGIRVCSQLRDCSSRWKVPGKLLMINAARDQRGLSLRLVPYADSVCSKVSKTAFLM
jgi:hypothetical protein